MAFYRYIPCPGNPSNVTFYTNINPTESLSGSTVFFNDPILAPLPAYVSGCYQVGQVSLIFPPLETYTVNWNLQTYTIFNDCIECTAATTYTNMYKFVSCCDPTDIIFFRSTETIVGSTYIYEGLTDENLQQDHCYTITREDITDYTYFYNLPIAPLSNFLIDVIDCNNEACLAACDFCFILEDCNNIVEPIYSTAYNLLQYVNKVVVIDGYDTCWTISTTLDSCDCAVTVNVLNSFDTCETCVPIKGYKLTECTLGTILYTTTDLFTSLDNIVKLDCGGCWSIETMDIIPPVSQDVVVINNFVDCKICNSVFYELVDCNGILGSIITITDLSQYVRQFIKLEYCPNTCWEVTITTPQEINGDVIVDQNFTTCLDCTNTLTDCKCQSAVNNLQIAKALTYVDCNSTEKTTAILLPGQRSEKVCALFWITGENIIDYGSCIYDAIAKQFTCPVPAQPKRKVTPGYNTAVCSTEYYERVVCNFADWMYKDVLERRYGISNCCPEELIKWEIKHEMLMLDVLVNPDYVCSTGSACNCPSSCDCGYISLTTKNGTCPS
jgi:hypothetical protein